MRKGIIYVYFNRAKYEKEGIERYYVGQTIRTMEQRAKKYGIGYGWTDPNCNTKFANSIRKWGWNAFECRVLEEVYEEDLDELEKFYIEQFDSFKNGYNSTIGGDGTRGCNVFANKTEEEMKETKKKISNSVKKSFENPEVREKCGHPGEKHPLVKSVYCRELNIIFSYSKLAAKYCKNVLNSKISSIGYVCDGKTKSTGKLANGTKLTWKYTEDVDQEILNNAELIDSEKYEEIIKAKLNENK